MAFLTHTLAPENPNGRTGGGVQRGFGLGAEILQRQQQQQQQQQQHAQCLGCILRHCIQFSLRA